MLPTAQPKPETRKRVQAHNRRVAAKIVRNVRARVVNRDVWCRACLYFYLAPTFNGGPLDWAHLEEWKRFKTRGKPADERHTTMGSCLLCREHHHAYDAGKLTLRFLSELGADGPIAWERT